MPIVNAHFREAGEHPGLARGWRLQSFVQAERIAGFGPLPDRGVEDFERWVQLKTKLELVVQVFFDPRPEGYEDFSEGWLNDTFVYWLRDARAESATFNGLFAETLRRGWLTDNYADRWSEVSEARASFAGAGAEGFERGHRNDGFIREWSRVQSASARLSAQTVEVFDATWPEHDGRAGDDH